MSSKAYITLSNGLKMPLVGLGTWQTFDEETARVSLENAFDAGYQLIDTAVVYKNEEIIGEVLQKNFEQGTISRRELFITTKLAPTHLHPDRQEECLRASLDRLQVDHVELLLAHMPAAINLDDTLDSSVTVEEIWQGMEQLYDAGLAKAIGVSNWSVSQMERVLAIARIPIHVAQNEIHIYFPQTRLLNFCRRNNIAITSFASLGSPSRQKAASHFIDAPNMMMEPIIVELAHKYEKTPAQILLKYLVQRRIAVIPKSSNPDRVRENIDIFDFKLEQEELEALNHVKHRQLMFTHPYMADHPEDGLADHRKLRTTQPIAE